MKRVVLVDPSASSDFAVRLTRAGFDVTQLGDCAIAAEQALAAPPHAVVAPARMSGISGIQLCRLLRAEPATARVSVILYGEDELRARFWASKAGAAAYLVGAEIDDLERCVANAVAAAPDEDGCSFSSMMEKGSFKRVSQSSSIRPSSIRRCALSLVAPRSMKRSGAWWPWCRSF